MDLWAHECQACVCSINNLNNIQHTLAYFYANSSILWIKIKPNTTLNSFLPFFRFSPLFCSTSFQFICFCFLLAWRFASGHYCLLISQIFCSFCFWNAQTCVSWWINGADRRILIAMWKKSVGISCKNHLVFIFDVIFSTKKSLKIVKIIKKKCFCLEQFEHYAIELKPERVEARSFLWNFNGSIFG